MRKTTLVFIAMATLGVVIIVQSCKKNKNDTDNALFSEVTASGYSYYQNGNTLSAAAPSPHGSFKLRFNSIAKAVLDSTGKLPKGINFPAGSIIVKDVQGSGGTNLYAIMKKDASNTNTGSGWLWAEIKTDGSVSFSTGKKGDGCISCHNGSPNRDLVRTFDLH